MKRFLLEQGHQCVCCKKTEWEGEKIPLEMNHKDGNPENNVISNVELLCRNCHGLTSTHKGKNRGRVGEGTVSPARGRGRKRLLPGV